MAELPPLIPRTGRNMHKMDKFPSLIPISDRNVHKMDELPPLIPISDRNVHKMDELPPLIPISDRNVYSWTLSYSMVSTIFNMGFSAICIVGMILDITLSAIYIATMSNLYEVPALLIAISCLSVANLIFLLNINDSYRSFVAIISIDIIRTCLVLYVFIAHLTGGPLFISNFPIIILIKIERFLVGDKFDANKHLYSLQV
jgi:hypothetical protein